MDHFGYCEILLSVFYYLVTQNQKVVLCTCIQILNMKYLLLIYSLEHLYVSTFLYLIQIKLHGELLGHVKGQLTLL